MASSMGSSASSQRGNAIRLDNVHSYVISDNITPWGGEIEGATGLTCQWHDQGWGNRKGMVFARTTGGTPYYGTWQPLSGNEAPHAITRLGVQLPFSLRGRRVQFGYRVGGGGGHEMHIEQAVVNVQGGTAPAPARPTGNAAARERPSYNAAFAVNQRVEVRCRGGNQWFTGKITNNLYDAVDRLYDILYDDGESEARVAESRIRRWVSTPHTGAPASARPMERGRADAAQDAYLRGVESLRLAAHRVQAAARERPPSHVFKGEWKPIWVGRWGHPGGRDSRTRETWFADGTGTWQTAGQSGTFSKVEPIEGEKGAYLVTCGPGDYEGCQIKRLTLDDNTCYWPEPKEYFTRICPVPPGTGGEVWESADGCACSIQ